VNIDHIDEAYVRHAAAGIDLELAPAHIPGVVVYCKMIAGMAALVNEFPLDEEMEHAAIFTPCSVPTRD
jgi:hypothetical protein